MKSRRREGVTTRGSNKTLPDYFTLSSRIAIVSMVEIDQDVAEEILRLIIHNKVHSLELRSIYIMSDEVASWFFYNILCGPIDVSLKIAECDADVDKLIYLIASTPGMSRQTTLDFYDCEISDETGLYLATLMNTSSGFTSFSLSHAQNISIFTSRILVGIVTSQHITHLRLNYMLFNYTAYRGITKRTLP